MDGNTTYSGDNLSVEASIVFPTDVYGTFNIPYKCIMFYYY